MHRMNTLQVTNILPSLLSLARNGFHRTLPTLPIVKSLSPFPRNITTYKKRCLSGMTNEGAYMPLYASSFVNVSTRPSFSTSSQIDVKQKIMDLKTINELLGLFETSKESFDIVNSIHVLHAVAKIVWKDAVERQELQTHRGASKQGRSVFRELLNHVADNVTSLDKKHKDDIIWSLDKIQETNHRLYQMANK